MGLHQQKKQNSHHNMFKPLNQTSWCAVCTSFWAVWALLMNTLTVSPTQATESAACWLRDPQTEEPSIKCRITPTLTPQTTAVMLCLFSCWLVASDRDPCSCAGYLNSAQRKKERAGESIHAPLHCQFIVICLKNYSFHNLVSIPDIQNKHYVHIMQIKYCFEHCCMKGKNIQVSALGKVGQSKNEVSTHPCRQGFAANAAE